MVILTLEVIKTIAALCIAAGPSNFEQSQRKCHSWYAECIDKKDKEAKVYEKGQEILLNKCLRERWQ